jgi:hypothetical protein
LSEVEVSQNAGKASSFRIKKILVKHAYIFLVIPLFLVLYPLLIPGVPITLDFPTIDTQDYPSDRLWAWWEKGSMPGLEGIPRIPFFAFWYSLLVIGLEGAILTKLNIVLGFLIISLSFYFSFYFLFKGGFRQDRIADAWLLKCSAILGALFYAYNPWSFERIVHWYLWIGYALLPAFLVSVFFVFRNHKDWKHILLSVFAWSLASGTPHMAVFYGMILVITFLIWVINVTIRNSKNSICAKRKLTRSALAFTFILSLFFLVNIYWIYPYILSSQVRSVSPNYLLVIENLESLSKQNDLLSTFTLIGNWLEQQKEVPFQGSIIYYLWLVSGIGIPIFGFFALVIVRSFTKYYIVFSLVAMTGILLAMGTESPIDYLSPLFSIPLLTKYLWLFRDPDKWSFLIALGYSFLLGIGSYGMLLLLSHFRNKRVKLLTISSFFFLVLGSISLFSFPVYVSNMQGTFKPVNLPVDFDRLNNYLSNLETDKVYFIPYPLDETTWNKLNRVGDIYHTHSVKPSIESTGFTGMAGMGSTNYYNYIEQSVIENHSSGIANFIAPLGTSYVIFHNDSWDKQANSMDSEKLQLLRRLEAIDSLKNLNSIGLYEVFKTGNMEESQQLNVFQNTVSAVGGLDMLRSLNSIQSFSSLNSSVLFVDDVPAEGTDEYIEMSDYIIFQDSPSFFELLFSLADRMHLAEPFLSADRYDPTKTWSKAGATDPDFGLFHPQIESLGVRNWQFDYGKGLVITQAAGAQMLSPFEIKESGNYDVFIRYLNSQKGGLIKIGLDNKSFSEIITEDYQRSNNRFEWERIGSAMNLTRGMHNVTLENVAGFNAINMISFIPSDEVVRSQERLDSIANDAANIYFLEAESRFYGTGNKGSNSSSGHVYPLLEYNVKDNVSKKVDGQLTSPPGADLLYLQFLAEKKITSDGGIENRSQSLVKNLEVRTTNRENYKYSLSFERQNTTIPLAVLRNTDFPIRDENLSTSLERTSSVNTALRVDVKQGVPAEWEIVSTDFIPIEDNRFYNFTLKIFARDANELHSKVLYYDSDKKRIKSEFLTQGQDGTFSETINSSIVPPLGTKFVKYEILVLLNPTKESTYLIDDLVFRETSPLMDLIKSGMYIERYPFPENKFITSRQQTVPLDSILPSNNRGSGFLGESGEVIIDTTNSLNKSASSPTSGYEIWQTGPIQVKANTTYDIEAELSTEYLEHLIATAYFKNTSGIVESPIAYGRESSGSVISLDAGSEIYADLDILKDSNYTIALRANSCSLVCGTDSQLVASIARVIPENGSYRIMEEATVPITGGKVNGSNAGDNDDNGSIKELKWIYLDPTYLEKGKYRLILYSDSQIDLDSVILFSTSQDEREEPRLDPEQIYTLEELFADSNSVSPASISNYNKTNPTRYEISISNATRPYLMSFAESYDPLWVASYNTQENSVDHLDKSQLNKRSVPAFSVTNGFYINKTGDYVVTIEYEPQRWIAEGATISAFALISILIFILISIRKKIPIGRKS